MNHPNRGKVRDWAAYIKAFRDRHGLTQQGLARLLMTSKRNIENWEAGTSKPPAFLKWALLYVDLRLKRKKNHTN